MPPEASRQDTLKKAREQEKKYDWFGAANSYRLVLQGDSEKVSNAPGIWERMGFCYQLASRQGEDFEEFKKLAHMAVEAYESAVEILEKENEEESRGKILQQHAAAEYVRSWLASDPLERKETLVRSYELAKRSLDASRNRGEELDYGRTVNDVLECLLERLRVASDFEEMRNLTQEGIECANQAIAVLSKSENRSELLRSYSIASLLTWHAANFVELEEKAQKELVQKSLDCSEKALELSEEMSDPYNKAMSNWAAALCTLVFTEKTELALKYGKRMLEQGIRVRDNYLEGVASYVLAFVTDWMMVREADPDRKKAGNRKIIKYAEDAIRWLKLVGQDFFIAETCMFYAETYFALEIYVESSPKERRIALEKAVNIGRKGLEHAIRSGSPDARASALHALSKALQFYSDIQARTDEKERLLQEALDCRKEFDNIIKKAFSSNSWLIGVNKNYQGLIKSGLAEIEPGKDRKRVMLESAVSDMKDGITHCRRWISSRPIPTQIATLGSFEDTLGTIFDDLYLLTKDKKDLIKAIEAHEAATKQFKKTSMPSRTAESYWKTARDQNRLGERQNAAVNFENACAEYTLAARNIPNFASFYDDHASYMKAWSEIEKATIAHECESYADAMEHYKSTAELLKKTKSWAYLSSSFFAWSFLEMAEDLSRKENTIESVDAFGKAAELFKEARETFDNEISKIQNLDEQEMAIEIGKASVRRKDYCQARRDVEEARILDREGKHAQSAEKYGSAAEAFERILKTMETRADRKEIEPFHYMCRAWQKMKMADKSASPELYHEASELFLKEKEHATKDRTTLLAHGNSAFCKALEHGTEFEATREKDHFSKTKQYLESAADLYLRAGFESASLWTNATEVLFDAYNYVIGAEVETDPHKKTRTYLLAEKCLERSAELYARASYIGRKQEVLKILEKVVEKREFAWSLGELFSAPGDASSPLAVSAPHLNVEEPVGLLKFEHAFLQANMIIEKREMLVGENLTLEIQIVNSGKDSAFLIEMRDIFPEGFSMIEKPEKCAVDGRLLRLKGKKMAPLETDEIRMRIKPSKRGTFTFAPRIKFMDETGTRKSCEIEPVTVTVKEMGIRSWLRGQ